MAICNKIARNRILVVDDDDGLRELIRKHLEKGGFEADCVANGAAAMAIIASHPPDAMLLDQNLPDLTGRQILDALAQQNAHIPFIVMTGQGDERFAVEMMKLGAADYLVKDTDFLDILPMAVARLFKAIEMERELKKTQKAYQESEAKFRAISESAFDAVILLDPEGKAAYWSPSAQRILGYDAEEVIGKVADDLLFAKPGETSFQKGFLQCTCIAEGPAVGSLLETFAWHRDGHEIPVEIALAPVSIHNQQWASAIIRDTTNRKRIEKELNNLAYFDTLTSLPNRDLFNDRLSKAIPVAHRNNQYIGIVFIDLDSFKTINDTMGHEAGDELLKRVAGKLSERVREMDTVCRFGGDEFLIMFPQLSDPLHLQQVAENVMHAFDEPFTLRARDFFITASAGIATYPLDGQDADSLIKNADLAMYSSKENGRNRYTFCSEGMKESIQLKMQLNNSLYRALEKGELVLHYQPQICIATREIMGLEALIRWQHPDLGLVSPSTFIPLAEKTGLINPIGQWVLRTACLQLSKWLKEGISPLHIAVNLSVEQIRNPDLVNIVENALHESGLNPAFLELEITESIAIIEDSYLSRVLSELKELGVSLSIDDFGTAYSSLSRIKQLPIDRIKMAMQFVHGISQNSKDEAIARSVVNLARNLGMKVIAEGVETEQQLGFLAENGCDEIQGFFFFRPMPLKEVSDLLHRKKAVNEKK